MRALLFITLLGIAAGAAADGPGSRIRATPAPPQPAGPVDKDLQRCESMDAAQKERCLRALRSAGGNAGSGATSGATGASTGTSGASSGTSGASSAVGGAR